MTELQQSFDTIIKRMQRKYSEKEELFHYPPCIVPAWESHIDEVIELVENWNEGCNKEEDKMGIFQIKEKFGTLVVYLEPRDMSGVANTPDYLREQIKNITERANKTCKKCGAQKVETVHESRIQYRCLENYCEDSRWRVRTC